MELNFNQISFLKKPLSLVLLGLFFCFLVIYSQFDSAIRFFNQPSKEDIHYLDSLVSQARNLSRLEPQKTLDLALKVLVKSEELNYKKGLADSYRLLSFSSWYNRNVVLTYEYLEKAELIYEELNYKQGLADIQMSYGGITSDMGDTLGALKNYKNAYSIFKGLDQKDRIRVASYNLAMIYTALNRLDSASFFLTQAEKLKEKTEDIPGFGVFQTLKGKIALKENNPDLAKVYLQGALEYFESNPGKESYIVFFESTLFLGRILKSQGKIDQAIGLLETSIDKESIFLSEFFSRLIFLDLVKLYELKGNVENANRVFWLKEKFEAELEKRKVKQAEIFSAELSLYRGFQLENEELNLKISAIKNWILIGLAFTFLLLLLFLRLIYLNRKNVELKILLDKSFQIAEIGTFEVNIDRKEGLRFIKISDTISKSLGRNPDFSLSSVYSLDQFLDPANQKKLKDLISKFSDKEEFFKGEFELKNFNGERKVVRMIAKVIPSKNGKVNLKGILLDITRESLVLEQVRENFEKEKNLKELREQLMHLTSHEIRTPLSNISSAVELMSLLYPKISPEDLQFRFKTIVQNARLSIGKLVEMLDDLLVYERVQSSELETKMETIDLIPFMKSIISEVKESKNSDVNILLLAPEYELKINSDRSLLHHIVTNLLENAVKYLDKNLPIEFEILEKGAFIQFRIKDYGIGIPEKDLERLFLPFKRASNVYGRPGSGLGLSIVKKMVFRLRGEVAVNSKQGEFSEFIVALPRSF